MSARFVERFGAELARAGWPRMSARLFACLMVEPDGRLSASDLASRLEVGPSAISTGARTLRDLGLLDVTRLSDRQIVYEIRPEAWVEATVGQDDRLRVLENILTEGARTVTDPSVAGRLAETAEFFAFLRSRLPDLVEQWRASRA